MKQDFKLDNMKGQTWIYSTFNWIVKSVRVLEAKMVTGDEGAGLKYKSA